MEHKTDFETNKHYLFDFCKIVRDNTVICSNNNQIHYFLDDNDAVLNAEIWIDERGLLHIESENKRTKQFYRDELGRVTFRFVNIPVNYILSNFTLSIK